MLRGAVPRPLDIPGTISMLQLQPLVLALPQLGLDPERVFGQVGLSLKEIADPNGRIAAGIEFDVWDAVQAAYGKPCVGLHVADLVKAGALGAYGYLLRNSTTLRVAIDYANRYERVVDDLSRVSLIENGASAMFRLWRVGDYPHPGEGVECLFAVIFKVMSDELPGPTLAREVRFAHRMIGPLEERTKRFGCPVRFDQRHHEIEFDAALLDLPVRSADPYLGEVLEDHVRIMLATLPTEDPLIHRARTALAASLSNGSSSLEALAETLHMSERTLRRRLEEHGTSYKQLLDELRQQLARYYVARTDESLELVASRLGFTEPSTFYRAFKRWEGTTPAAYRSRKPSP